MSSLYEIEYKFEDERLEDGWRTGLVLVYETGTVFIANLIRKNADEEQERQYK